MFVHEESSISQVSLGKAALSILKSIVSIWEYPIVTTANKETITLGSVAMGIILFIMGLRLAKKLSRITRVKLLDRLSIDLTVSDALEKVSHYLYIVFITLAVLQISHVPLTIFTFVGGALAIGLGFGSQNILSNFISGLIIMVEQPIKVGDYIEIDLFGKTSTVAKVKNIGARCIHLQTNNNVDIMLPNKNILENTIINWTLSDNKVKLSVMIPVQIDQSAELVKEILTKVIHTHPDILNDPAPEVLLTGFSYATMEFELNFWVDMATPNLNRKAVIDYINYETKKEFDKHKIQLAVKLSDIYTHRE